MFPRVESRFFPVLRKESLVKPPNANDQVILHWFNMLLLSNATQILLSTSISYSFTVLGKFYAYLIFLVQFIKFLVSGYWDSTWLKPGTYIVDTIW